MDFFHSTKELTVPAKKAHCRNVLILTLSRPRAMALAPASVILTARSLMSSGNCGDSEKRVFYTGLGLNIFYRSRSSATRLFDVENIQGREK